MNYLLRVSDHLNQHLVVITLDQQTAKQPAVDIVFEILGAEKPEELIEEGRLPQGQIEDLRALQQIIFDRDSDGLFISNSVDFVANGEALDPEAPLLQAFVPSERDSVKYMRCDLVVLDKSNSSASSGQPNNANQTTTEKKVEEFGRVMFLHQIAVGTIIDVTKDNGDLVDVIAYGERENLIEIDVKKAAYKLSEKGKRMHDSYIAEAQDLIKRFDIYGDVDVDSAGTAHFDTNLGRDLRVAAFEAEGVDPFRARFLLGLNDGEWDKLDNWTEVFQDPTWYGQIFAPVEQAASVEEIGESNLRRIIEQAKATLRLS
ncbi:hypothetical protein KBI23_04875 [bacterium]|nr:hypothetical protein [bacterium]MBP9807228.1 hypothetical protein [bacterium]